MKNVKKQANIVIIISNGYIGFKNVYITGSGDHSHSTVAGGLLVMS